MQKLTLTGKFPKGLVIAGKKYIAFRMQEADVGTLIDAEADVGPGTIVAFSVAMQSRQLVEVAAEDGDIYTGPFVVDMFRRLHPADYRALRDVQEQLDKLGNEEPSA